MFRRRKNLIIAVHNDELIWLSGRKDSNYVCELRLSMEAVLRGDKLIEKIPKSLRGNYRSVLIVPDHWFGNESYPFRSRKASLIKPFLERKLCAEYSELKGLRNFISYRHASVVGDGEGVIAYFLQDIKSYQLYEVLRKLNLCPRKITTPAFLWMDALSKVTPEFDYSGTLLMHMIDYECLLYFYFNGNYLFSRNVILSETKDRLDALNFEINQSLYMFSQKTKSELKKLFLVNGSPGDLDYLQQALGREVIDIDSHIDYPDLLENKDLPFLNGLLRRKHLSLSTSFFYVSHRQVRHELEWEPVQWAGIGIGVLLLLPLIGENLILERMLNHQRDDARKYYQQIQHTGGNILGDAESELDQVLQVVRKPKVHDAVYSLLTSLPDEVRIKEIDISLEGQATVSLTAFVSATDSDHLKRTLTQLTGQIRQRFTRAQDFSINNIAIQTDNYGDLKDRFPYTLSFELDLI
ncbi:MAG: hypothetical protein PVI90_19415 [Desulfobacteraceae bacterium]